MRTLFGAPQKVIFCKKCNQSNQRPCSTYEYQHDFSRTGSMYTNINKDGVCDACLYIDKKFNYIIDDNGVCLSDGGNQLLYIEL